MLHQWQLIASRADVIQYLIDQRWFHGVAEKVERTGDRILQSGARHAGREDLVQEVEDFECSWSGLVLLPRCWVAEPNANKEQDAQVDEQVYGAKSQDQRYKCPSPSD